MIGSEAALPKIPDVAFLTSEARGSLELIQARSIADRLSGPLPERAGRGCCLRADDPGIRFHPHVRHGLLLRAG